MTSSDMTVPDHRSVDAFQGQNVRLLHCGQPRYATLTATVVQTMLTRNLGRLAARRPRWA